MFFEEGELRKLTITVLEYSEGRPQTDDSRHYTVQVNPATLSLNKQIRYQRNEPPGNQESTQRHVASGPSTLSFEIIFDGTGVVTNASTLDQIPAVGAIASMISGEETFDVAEQIENFENVVYWYDGQIHQPNKVRLAWGEGLSFDGALTSISYSYTLFKPDGAPLRAKANCSFVKTVSPQQQAQEQSDTSPDLTHVRDFKDGDTLPLIAHRIYGKPELYLEVARVNKLINFRRIKAGQKIILPPIDKSANQ